MAKKKAATRKPAQPTKKAPRGLKLRGDTYYANATIGGERHREKLSQDLRVAEMLLAKMRYDHETKRHGLKKNPTWKEMTESYLLEAEQTCRTWKEYKTIIAKFVEYGAPKRLYDIDSTYVLEYRRWRAKQHVRGDKDRPLVSKRTINKEVGFLHAMINKAIEGTTTRSLIADVRPLPEDEPRKRRRALRLDECNSLLEVSPLVYRGIWWLLLSTGCRRDEAVELTWSQISTEERTVHFLSDVAKSKKDRHVPLTNAVMELIENLPRVSEYVFAGPAGEHLNQNALREFQRHAKWAGIPDAIPGGMVDLHALRVTFVTRTLDAGVKVRAVADIVGHKHISTTLQLYDKAASSDHLAAVNSIPLHMTKDTNRTRKRHALTQDTIDKRFKKKDLRTFNP